MPGLDGLRTFAVAAVIVTHAAEPLMRGGAIGVDIFFVLSGFVITRMLLQERERIGRLDLRNFYVQRLLRLAPALLAVCVVVVAWTAVSGPWGVQWRQALVSALYLTDLQRAAAPVLENPSSLLGHTWSLAVEEQFYLAWPLVLLILLTRVSRTRTRLALVLAACCLPLLLRVLLWTGYEASWNRVYFAPDTRADQLLYGCALAIAIHAASPERLDRWRWVVGRAAWPAATALVAVCLFVPTSGLPPLAATAFYTVGFSAVALCAVVLVATVALVPDHPLTRLLSRHPFSWTGRNLSYGLYVWHFPVVIVVNSFDPPVQPVIAVALSVVLAVASWRFVEGPVNSWRLRKAPLASHGRQALPSDH